MKFSIALTALTGACLVQSQGNMIPLPGSTKPVSQRDIAYLTFYSFSFAAKAPILRFESTLLVPTASPDISANGNVQAVWPGLQTDTLLQNVLTNQGGDGPHQWGHLPFACCGPALNLMDGGIQVYPGDSITNIYLWDIPADKWLDSWAVTPGTEGSQAGEKAFHGGLTFDQKSVFKPDNAQKLTPRAYDTAVLAIELQGLGTWDFGPVHWRNIVIEASTTETEWCMGFVGSGNLDWEASTPRVNTEGSVTTCYVASFIFKAPMEKVRRPLRKRW
jgi:hypothetical protein